jgi:hypothetical protein
VVTIFKFPIYIGKGQTIQVPKGAQFLTANEQDGALWVWALVNPVAQNEPAVISVFGTGFTIPQIPLLHIGTIFCRDGMVWHVFKHQ